MYIYIYIHMYIDRKTSRCINVSQSPVLTVAFRIDAGFVRCCGRFGRVEPVYALIFGRLKLVVMESWHRLLTGSVSA